MFKTIRESLPLAVNTRSLLFGSLHRTFATANFAKKVLIETHELEQLMKEQPENVSIFNASYPTATIKPRENHLLKRIPRSVFFDFDEFSNRGSKLSYTVPSVDSFAENMKRLDVRKSDIVVVYDKVGMLSSPRAVWLLKTFGMPNVLLLNGTFSKWDAEKRPTTENDSECAWNRQNRKSLPHADDFKFSFDNKKIRYFEDIIKTNALN